MESFAKSAGLLLVLLNPFLMSIYLIDLIQTLDAPTFRRVLARGAFISGTTFIVIAWTGEILFTNVLQVRFSSFLLFGGVIFLVLAIRWVFDGITAIEAMRGPPEHVAGSIAMPFMIGPGTVSASVIIGQRHLFPLDAMAIVAALLIMVATLLVFKAGHDWVRHENERILARYVDITGRIMALVMGTIAVEMILKGLDLWLGRGTPDGT